VPKYKDPIAKFIPPDIAAAIETVDWAALAGIGK
jgi:hypothetical protein